MIINLQFILGILFTMLPITELRVGLPIIINYALSNNLPIFPFFLLVVFLNCIIVFPIFFFLDFIHHRLLKFKNYASLSKKYLDSLQTKAEKIEKRIPTLGFLALTIFVAIPFPGTGVWTGTIIAWLLKLNRTKSIISISIGALIAGILMLAGSFGFLTLFY